MEVWDRVEIIDTTDEACGFVGIVFNVLNENTVVVDIDDLMSTREFNVDQLRLLK